MTFSIGRVSTSSYLISRSDTRRFRRASDATGVLIGLVLVLWAWRRYVAIDDAAAAADSIVASVPSWLTGSFAVIYGLCLLYGVVLFVAVAFQGSGRRKALRDMTVALALSGLFVVLGVRWIDGAWPRVLPELGLADPFPQFPVLRVVLVSSLLFALGPHLTRPMRRMNWVVVAGSATSAVLLGFALPSSAVGAVALGVLSSGVVLLIFGSPGGYPDPESISSSLRVLGLPLNHLSVDQEQPWGVRKLSGVSDQFGPVEVKAYGRDAADSSTARRAWRYLWFRDTEPSLSFTRRQVVEHEALVTMMARRTGAAVGEVLAVGIGNDDTALLAVQRSGESLRRTDPDTVTDDDLAAVWESISSLHKAGISHGSLDLAAIYIHRSNHLVTDFSSGAVASSRPLQLIDIANFLFALCGYVGVDRSVASAHRGLGREALAEALPYIQLPAVSRHTKKGIDDSKQRIADIRAKVGEVAGVEQEESVEIRRVSPRSLVFAALSLFAVYFLVTQLSTIDFAAVWDVVQDASWPLIVFAFAVGQTVYFPQATGMLAAVGKPIPLRPLMILQSAIMFMGLAISSTAARVATNAAFLRKYGISLTSSLIQGLLDTVAGLAVEIAILAIALIFGDFSISIGSEERNWAQILLLVVVALVVVVVGALRFERIRSRVMPAVAEVVGALKGVFSDSKRTFVLIASNVGSRLVLATSMWLILQSMGVPLGILAVLTAVVAAGLLAGLIPIPGGVGVSEAVLAAFLVIFGVDQVVAFAAAVVFRVATFYIPAVAGFFSMKWLEREGYI